MRKQSRNSRYRSHTGLYEAGPIESNKSLRVSSNFHQLAGLVPINLPDEMKGYFNVKSPDKTIKDNGDVLQQVAYKMYHDTAVKREKTHGKILSQLEIQNQFMK